MAPAKLISIIGSLYLDLDFEPQPEQKNLHGLIHSGWEVHYDGSSEQLFLSDEADRVSWKIEPPGVNRYARCVPIEPLCDVNKTFSY